MDVDDAPAYLLREELRGHGAAVRSLCYCSTGTLVSGGADAVVNRWEVRESGGGGGGGGSGTPQAPPIYDHEHNVLAILDLPAGRLDDCPTGGFVTGSQDRHIRVYNAEGTMVRQLAGHDHGVISLSWSASGELLSGSWDGTAKVWDLAGESSCVATLGNHENGVCVLGLPNGDVATGSTGKKAEGGAPTGFQVRIWRNSTEVVASAKDHGGPVRSLCLAPNGVGFLSTSNDGTAVLRDFAGEPLVVMRHPQQGGGENFIYCGAAVGGDGGSSSDGGGGGGGGGAAEYLSCSEDCTVAVWRDGQAVQLLEHPDGVWAVCALPDGDVATACNDGVVRLFTRDAGRAAPEGLREAYADAVRAAAAKKRGGPSAEEIAKLDLWDARQTVAGRGEGDVKVFNKRGVAIAAQWSASMSDWVEVGEVTGSRDSGTVDGKQYDHVIPVEFEQPGMGMVKLQIGHNDGDNPYTTAQLFIAKHGLDPDFLEKIANHITSNAGNAGPTLGMDGGGSGGGSGGASQFTNDPSTSSDRNMKRARGADVGPSSASSSSSVQSQYCAFEKPTAVDKIQGKILEFNDVVEKAVALRDGDHIVLANLCATLGKSNRWHASSVSDEEVRLLLKLLSSWPNAQVFPVVDLLRIAILHPDGAAKVGQPHVAARLFGTGTDATSSSSSSSSSSSASDGKAEMDEEGKSGGGGGSDDREALGVLGSCLARASDLSDSSIPMAMQLVALRCACNCFFHPPTRGVVAATARRAETLLQAAWNLVSSPTKNVRLAAASLLLNYATALRDKGGGGTALTPGGAAAASACAMVYEGASDAFSAAAFNANTDDDTLQRAILAVKLCVEATGDVAAVKDGPLAAAISRLSAATGVGPKGAAALSELTTVLASKGF